MTTGACPICSLPPQHIVLESDIQICDAFQVTASHSLVVPRRYAIDCFGL